MYGELVNNEKCVIVSCGYLFKYKRVFMILLSDCEMKLKCFILIKFFFLFFCKCERVVFY